MHKNSIPPKKPASLSAKTFPTIRLTEDPQHVTIVAVVPGFSHEDLDVAVENDVLRITGRLRQQIPQNMPSVKKERLASDFSRTIKLANDVLKSQTEARLEHGVLTVKMRKCGPTDRVAIPFRQT
jgi:HSP20 family protein